MNLLVVLWIYFKFSRFLAYILCIHYLLRNFAMKLLCFSWIHFEFTFHSLGISRFAMNLLVVSRFTMSSFYFSRNHYLFRELIMYLFSFTRINYLSGEFTVNSLGLSQIYQEFTFCFAMTLWIHYLISESTMNWLCVRVIHIYYAYSLWFHYLFREYTFVALFFAN